MSDSDDGGDHFIRDDGHGDNFEISPILFTDTIVNRRVQESPSIRRQASLTSDLNNLKAPWVHSPAKTSSQTNIIFSRKTRYSLPSKPSGSTEEMKISDMTVPTPQSSLSSIASSTGDPVVVSKNPSSAALSRHRLQSKDSFVDVTACLTRKRHEIMTLLWDEKLTSSSSTLLENLQNANTYGIEAATHLDQLKHSVQGRVHDTKSIESLRNKVMESLKKFEMYNKTVHQLISNKKGVEPPPNPVVAIEDASENMDLTQLNKLYAENFSLSNVKTSKEYKRLEEKFAEQKQTVKSLECELKRVESQCAFDYRLLKSSLSEKLDDLNGFPEILHVLEIKLGQCMARNAVLEKAAQDKENDVSKLEYELNINKSKVETLTKEIRNVERENSQLKGRLKELETVNQAFKKETSTENILKTIESKLELLRTDSTTSKIEELEEKLRLAKKHIQQQKKAKEDVTSRLTRRVEELMEALDDSKQKNHTLRSQLLFIRTSYHKLFPLHTFGLEEPCGDDDDNNMLKQLHSTNN